MTGLEAVELFTGSAFASVLGLVEQWNKHPVLVIYFHAPTYPLEPSPRAKWPW